MRVISKRHWGNDMVGESRLFKCDQCGKTFPRKKSQAKGNHHFCSSECSAVFQRGRPRK
jgi:hypothetical protein